MDPVEFRDLASLEPSKLVGVTAVRLSNCAPACLDQLPPKLESLWSSYGELPRPLRFDRLVSLKSLALSPPAHPSRGPIAIEALPPSLEELDLWSCVVERLPVPLPSLKKLTFHSSDLRAVPWDRLPASLENLSAVRCMLPQPLTLSPLPALKYVSFALTNLSDARQLLRAPKLELVSLGLTPLDDESLTALMALGKTGVDITDVKRAQFELTRQLYALGVNLSAEHQPRKKIRLHSPMMSVAQDFPREEVLTLIQRVERGEAKFVGAEFIAEVSRQTHARKVAARAAKKAARKSAQ